MFEDTMSCYQELITVFKENDHLQYIRQLLIDDTKAYLSVEAMPFRAPAMPSLEKLINQVLKSPTFIPN